MRMSWCHVEKIEVPYNEEVITFKTSEVYGDEYISTGMLKDVNFNVLMRTAYYKKYNRCELYLKTRYLKDMFSIIVSYIDENKNRHNKNLVEFLDVELNVMVDKEFKVKRFVNEPFMGILTLYYKPGQLYECELHFIWDCIERKDLRDKN